MTKSPAIRLLATGSALLLVFLCAPGPAPEAQRGSAARGDGLPRSLVVITVDTLRPDRLDVYGYPRIRTPNIARLAKQGVRFANAVTPVPLTLPAHCSIFTGTYPVFHGVRDHSGFLLDDRSETLASRLKSAGFVTGAFVGSFVLDSRFGLDRGFDHYFDRFDATRAKSGNPESLEHRAETVAAEALRWMEAQAGSRFFAWIHFYDPHAPYAPPEPFRSQYPRDPYDGEVAYTDSVIGSVLEFLDRKELYEDSLVILTSDHGEDLGDHGESTHGYFVYDSTVRIPLIMKLPRSRFAGKVIDPQVRAIDIFPTILQLLRLPPSGRVQGRGLMTLIASGEARSEEDALGESYYPYYHFGWSPLLYIRTGRFKYIDAPRPELYDLSSDPGEARNIEGSERAMAGQLRARLRAAYSRLGTAEQSQKQQTDPATLEKLRSLGYVTYSSRTARPGVDESLPDPKDKLRIYNLMQQAQLESRSAPQTAIRKLKELVSREPGLVDAHIQLGLLHKGTGQFEQAVDSFKEALKSDSSNVIATYNLAHSYAGWGKLDEAILGFNRTLELDPREVRAHVGLGIAYQTRGALPDAIRAYRAALAIDPEDTTARNNLGSIYLMQRDPAGALAELRRSAEVDPQRAETRNLMGSAYWLRDDPDRAIAEFREAIRLDGKYIDAYLNLGSLLSQLGRTREALSYLKPAAELAPRSARVYEMLGRAYRSAGLQEEADKAFSRARELSGQRP